MQTAAPLLEVQGLTKRFDLRRGLARLVKPAQGHTVHALENVSLSVPRGATLGVIGESGCGKTTLGRTVLHLQSPTAGSVRFDGQDLGHLDAEGRKAIRRRMQIIFQDPYASLNPRRNVEEIVGLGGCGSITASVGARPVTGWWSCWKVWGSRPPICAATRISSRAASVNGSASPAP
jgi:ABC-type glutathione transport system ATPase component